MKQSFLDFISGFLLIFLIFMAHIILFGVVIAPAILAFIFLSKWYLLGFLITIPLGIIILNQFDK